MNWLITGGCGFIGRALIMHLLDHDANKIQALDNLSVGARAEVEAVGPVTTFASANHRLVALNGIVGVM